MDARSKERFYGEVPEPRPIPSGHMPYSHSLPFNQLINENGYMKTVILILNLGWRNKGNSK